MVQRTMGDYMDKIAKGLDDDRAQYDICRPFFFFKINLTLKISK